MLRPSPIWAVDPRGPAQGDLATLRKQAAEDAAALERAKAQLQRVESTSVDQHPEVVAAEARVPESGDTCPTCGRDGWTAAERAVIQATEKREEVSHRRAEALQIAREAVEQAAPKASESAAAVAALEWDARRAQIGDAPPAATEPSGAKPADAEISAARATLDAAKHAAARMEQHREQVAAAEQAIRDAEQHAKATAAEAATAQRLVEVLRAAPSKVLAGRIGALRMDGVELRLVGDGIEAVVDGRPWGAASRGRQTRADLEIRNAIRATAGMRWLPLVVDNAQDWSGDWPDVGPAVFLWTRAQSAAALGVSA